MTKTKYKFLNLYRNQIKSSSGDMKWRLNEWQHVDGEIIACKNGLHCSDKIREAFNYVQGEVLAIVETKGKNDIGDNKSAWSDMRIVKAYKWTKKDSVALAIFSAELCLKNFEKLYPDDKQPRQAIEAAKAVLLHDTAKNRSAASAGSAAVYAAWSAAGSAAAYAAWSAAGSAGSAARSAAYTAGSAGSAAGSAAAYAAKSAGSAARSALQNKIEKWLKEHIKELEEII